MQREILFRGKRKDIKQFIQGSLSVEYDGLCFISYWENQLIEPENNYHELVCKWHEVHPETVGQFTGLTDKNGNKIFEGDKIKIWSFYHQSGNTADWFGAEPQNSQPCYEEFLETICVTVEFKNGSFVAKNAYHEIPLYEVVKGLGQEVSHFYLCGYGGSELHFIECFNDIESYPENYYDELKSLEGERFYNRLEEIVNEITQEIEIIGNIHEK